MLPFKLPNLFVGSANCKGNLHTHEWPSLPNALHYTTVMKIETSRQAKLSFFQHDLGLMILKCSSHCITSVRSNSSKTYMTVNQAGTEGKFPPNHTPAGHIKLTRREREGGWQRTWFNRFAISVLPSRAAPRQSSQ